MMADDSMEIASDLGHDHDAADDYLDLDIDLTNVRPDDEDFVLEDAASTMDSGEHHTLQPPPLVGGDHIMLDDEEYKDELYDDDLLQEGQEHVMEEEAPSQSFVTVNETYSEYHETEVTSDVVEGDFNDPVGPIWANEEPSAIETLESNLYSRDNDNLRYQAVEGANDPQKDNETEEHPDPAIHRESRTTSPVQASQVRLAVEESGSPSSDRQRSASRHGSVSHSNPEEYHNEALNEQDQTHDNNTPSHHAGLSGTENILVIYQGLEYALFGSADSENPDSFFLSDQSIAEKPISDFFKSVRDVIHEDLSEEDELCVLVKHLGLEIEETVCSLHDVTISQIFELHGKLSANDANETHRPLCICLTTRPSFARRLANLVTGAAEGKGLSQLVVLGENSEEFDNSGDGTEDFENFVVPVEDEYTDEGFDNDLQAPVTDLVVENGEDPYSIEEAGNQHEEESTYEGNPEENEFVGDASTYPAAELQVHLEAASSVNEPPKDRYSSDGLDEDGDLIDYSEDELGPAHVSAHTDQNNNENDIKENSEPSSVSPPSRGQQQTREQTPPASQEHGAYEGGAVSDAEPEVLDRAGNLDVANTEDWGLAAEEESHEYFAGGNADAIDEVATNDYLDLSVDAVGHGDDKTADIGSFAEPEGIADPEQHETFEGTDSEHVEPEYEIDYNLDDDSHSPSQDRNPDKPIDITTSNSGITRNEDIVDSFGTESEAVDNANSSTTLSLNNGHDDDGLEFYEDDALDAPTTTITDQKSPLGANAKDEIDYDEDDYGQELASPSKPEKSVLSAITNGGSGKRSWQESDDGLDVTDKEPKRVRS